MSFWGKLNKYGMPWTVNGPMTIVSDEKVYFRDTGIYIQSNADGKLIISADGGGSDDITLSGGVTITGNVAITGAVTQTSGYKLVADAATAALLAADSGKVHLLPDMTAACTISPPANTAGLVYEFEYIGGAEDAHGIVIDTGSDTNFFIGGVSHIDSDANSAGDEVVAVFSDGDSNSKFTASTVGPGTRVRIICDGTNWYISGVVVGATAPAFADQ